MFYNNIYKADCFMKRATILAKDVEVSLMEVKEGYCEMKEAKQ